MLSFHTNTKLTPQPIAYGIQGASGAYVADSAAGDSVKKMKPANTTNP